MQCQQLRSMSEFQYLIKCLCKLDMIDVNKSTDVNNQTTIVTRLYKALIHPITESIDSPIHLPIAMLSLFMKIIFCPYFLLARLTGVQWILAHLNPPFTTVTHHECIIQHITILRRPSFQHTLFFKFYQYPKTIKAKD